MSRLDKNKNGQDVEVNRRKSIAVVFAEVTKRRNAPEQKRGRGRPRKNKGPPKETVIHEELIKTHNIAALIKTEQQKWNACLIKTM